MIVGEEFLKQCKTEIYLDASKSVKWYTKQNLQTYWIQINLKTGNWSREQVQLKVFYCHFFMGHPVGHNDNRNNKNHTKNHKNQRYHKAISSYVFTVQ